MPRPYQKYQTEEERREAIRKNKLRYYHNHRKAISVRRSKAHKSKQAAIEEGQKET